MEQILRRRTSVIYSAGNLVAAALLAIGLLVPSVVWIFRDLRVWPWDQAYYAELTLKIHYAMMHGPGAAFKAFLTIPDSRAPLLPWLAQATTPLIKAFGSPERAMLLTNIAAGAVTLSLVYSATRQFGGNLGTALVAMLVAASTSDFVAFNHQYLVESVQSMAVAGLACIALRADRSSPLRLAAGTIFWVALALLAKTTSLEFIAPFLLYISIVCATSGAKRQSAASIDVWLLLGASTLAALTIAWYTINWSAMFAHVVEATNSNIAELYGSVRSLTAKMQFWSRELLRAISPFPWLAELILVVPVVGVIVAVKRQVGGGSKRLLDAAVESRLFFALCLIGTVVVSLLVYSRAIEEDPRFLAPLVPLVVLLFSWSLSTLRKSLAHCWHGPNDRLQLGGDACDCAGACFLSTGARLFAGSEVRSNRNNAADPCGS